MEKLVSMIGFVLGSWLALSPVQTSGAETEPGQDWVGSLVDADCRSVNPQGDCLVLKRTKSFGLETSDHKYYRLDLETNYKVQRALQARKNKAGILKASLHGVANGDVLRADTVNIR